MDPGYELHLKLMTDFSLPNDQYGIMSCVPRTKDVADHDIIICQEVQDSPELRANVPTKTHSDSAERNECPDISQLIPTGTTRSQLCKPSVHLVQEACNASAHCFMLQQELEGRGYTVVNNNHSCFNGEVPPDISIRDTFDQVRSSALSHLVADRDAVVVMNSFGGIVPTHALLGQGSNSIESRPDKSTGRCLGSIHLYIFVSSFEGFLEDVRDIVSSKRLNADTADDVMLLSAEHIDERLQKDPKTDQQKRAFCRIVSIPLSVSTGSQVRDILGVPACKTIPTT